MSDKPDVEILDDMEDEERCSNEAAESSPSVDINEDVSSGLCAGPDRRGSDTVNHTYSGNDYHAFASDGDFPGRGGEPHEQHTSRTSSSSGRLADGSKSADANASANPPVEDHTGLSAEGANPGTAALVSRESSAKEGPDGSCATACPPQTEDVKTRTAAQEREDGAAGISHGNGGASTLCGEQPESGPASSSHLLDGNSNTKDGALPGGEDKLCRSQQRLRLFGSSEGVLLPEKADEGLPGSDLVCGVEDFELNRRAFLTEKRDLRVDDHTSGRPDSRRALFETLKNGPQIREGVERIHEMLDTLDQKVDKLLGDHERDFLLAYRTHMYTIQKQMDYFKQKADEEQTKLLRDVKIRTLEKELNWFMSEALRLDGLCRQYQKDLNKWRDRAEALSEDCAFLEKQVRSCKRQTRALQARVDECESEGQAPTDVGNPAGREPPSRDASAEHSSPLSSRNRQQVFSLSSPSAVPTSLPAFASKGDSEHLPFVTASEASAFGRSSCCDRATEFLRSQNAKLRTSLQKEKRIVKQLRLEQSNAVSDRNEAEDFFLKCCEEVKKEIQARKTRTISSSKPKSTKGQAHNSEDLWQPNGDLPRDLTLQDFLKSDKRRLLELIVSNDDILAQLHTVLFPYQTAGRAAMPPALDESPAA
ncbi:putative myosin heavy chain [Besnoitia besnoiti]|uniref:Putative myosin heavy chain n=1 Tax=Besnoitia besnoiti TaxID=94643 RepID=A0A2A9M3R5_BESBE|nr:putative myosin heavy chain [Besnoitia besnoiti]PFH32595.1 putative myosin heavy chain [Besnoitia besnoiti]